jgi:energy-converting hydrogenase Eha subunit G
MNDKAKALINKQNEKIYQNLVDTFQLPVFQDDVAESERPNELNLFLIIYGELQEGENQGNINQEIYITYLAENSNTVETDQLDIISSITKINAICFVRTERDRVQKLETDEFVDRVNFIFRRGIRYECSV